MSKKPFTIIHNLESLDDSQRKAYADSVAEFVGLDPTLNPFDYVWIPDEVTGFKKLVLYARRGTTDILREKNDISIIDMVQHDGPGYVSFKAIGKNATGRQEVAVGVHSVEGLKGERLAAAVSTAETRAGRRLTLKFVGLGILDAAEVNLDTHSSINTSAASEAKPDGAPVVFPPPQQHAAAVSPHTPVSTSAETVPIAESPEDFSKRQQALRDEAQAQLQAKPWGNSAPPATVNEGGVPLTPDKDCTLPSAEPVKRKRRSRKTVDLNLPGQTPSAPPTPPPAASVAQPPAQPEKTWQPVGGGPALTLADIQAAEKKVDAALGVPPQANPAVPSQAFGAQTPIVPPAAPAPPAPPFVGSIPPALQPVNDFPGKPTEEQQKQFREKIREITSRLSMAGMMPSENIGGPPAKMRLFAEKMSGKPTAQMTVDDWSDFFSSVDAFLGRNSDKNLVQYVNDVIGAK